jgi:hypothetical protein
MNAQDIGRLQHVDLRSIWAHEAHDFTQWMLTNADVLSEVLGMQLELTAAEQKVGGFSLDLIGQDLSTGETVIVENQLEQTDHSHLGQLLTYAGGTDPTTIVWCAPSFREEHRAALDWLNDRTDEGSRFFGVEVAAVRIDDSRPAPLFSLVAKPNDWAKRVHRQKDSALTGRGAAYSAFWADLLQRIRTEHPGWTASTGGSSGSWITLPYGKSSVWYGVLFSQKGPAVELYFGSSDPDENLEAFEQFADRAGLLQAQFGHELEFEPLPGKKACRIRYYRPGGGDVLDESSRAEYLDWFVSTVGALRTAVQAAKATF